MTPAATTKIFLPNFSPQVTIQGPVMPQKAWSAKRERQYSHIKDSLLEGGKPVALADEIAARVGNKERAQLGESVTISASSIKDMSAGRRGGLRSHQWWWSHRAAASQRVSSARSERTIRDEQSAA
jgi:hypothetical protein